MLGWTLAGMNLTKLKRIIEVYFVYILKIYGTELDLFYIVHKIDVELNICIYLLLLLD